jgi:hypothetical protein
MKDRIITIPHIEKNTLTGKIIQVLIKSKGLTLSEVYTELPDYNPRSIRECVSRLISQNMIRKTKCRCGNTPIYEVI